ncbi:MAG: hypothetical protein D4S02_02250 [Rhodocyclaceae bacterium]|nr:MAG: hypothetical protein D4S02_02250 [Rhodocyclaceae bacterium]
MTDLRQRRTPSPRSIAQQASLHRRSYVLFLLVCLAVSYVAAELEGQVRGSEFEEIFDSSRH